MGLWKSFLDILFEDENEVDISTVKISSDYMTDLWQYKMALHVVSERIGAILSKCEIKTILKEDVTYGDMWFLLNYEPNPNQSGCEFMKQLVHQLIFSPKHEALIVKVKVNGKDRLYVATDYEENDMELYNRVYTNVVINTKGEGKGYKLRDIFTTDTAIKIKYVNSGLTYIYNQMKSTYQKMIKNALSAGTFTQKYVLELDNTAEADPDFNEHLQQLLDEDFEQFIKGENAILPLYNGMKLERKSNAQEVSQNASISNDSINKQNKEILGLVGQPFNIPLSVMLGTYEENDMDDFLTFCIDSLADLISEAFTRKMFSKDEVKKKSYIQMDTKKIKHFDILTVSNSINKLISSGVYTINEIRGILDEKPVDSKIGDVHWITRNYAIVGDYIQEQQNYAVQKGKEDEEGADDEE